MIADFVADMNRWLSQGGMFHVEHPALIACFGSGESLFADTEPGKNLAEQIFRSYFSSNR
jgi:hypothetical protein